MPFKYRKGCCEPKKEEIEIFVCPKCKTKRALDIPEGNKLDIKCSGCKETWQIWLGRSIYSK